MRNGRNQRKIPGDIIETGVAGRTVLMRAILKPFDVADRIVWVADSFEGLPETDVDRFQREATAYHGPTMRQAVDHLPPVSRCSSEF